jgi:hypothetical protein
MQGTHLPLMLQLLRHIEASKQGSDSLLPIPDEKIRYAQTPLKIADKFFIATFIQLWQGIFQQINSIIRVSVLQVQISEMRFGTAYCSCRPQSTGDLAGSFIISLSLLELSLFLGELT